MLTVAILNELNQLLGARKMQTPTGNRRKKQISV